MADNSKKKVGTAQDNYPSVGQFCVSNAGDFVIDIHALYKGPQSSKFIEVANGNNITKSYSGTMDLAQKCPNIKPGDMVMLKIWVQAGNDVTSNLVFSYDPNGPKQWFEADGTTLDDSLNYIGAAPLPVKQFRLKNGGAFVADIHALYKNPGSKEYVEESNCHNIAVGQEATMDLGKKCPGIQAGASVLFKVWVMAGIDKTYDVEFIYSPTGPEQDLECGGLTTFCFIFYIGTQPCSNQ